MFIFQCVCVCAKKPNLLETAKSVKNFCWSGCGWALSEAEAEAVDPVRIVPKKMNMNMFCC